MKDYKSLNQLLIEQLQDVFDAESQLVKTLPRLAAAARTEELTTALESHHKETSEHLARLHDIFGSLDIKTERKSCRPMAILIEEAEEVTGATGDPRVIDAAIIAAAQRILHYKMAAYGCTKAFAVCEDEERIAGILDESVNEAGAADKLLSRIAVGTIFRKSVNKEAAKAGS